DGCARDGEPCERVWQLGADLGALRPAGTRGQWLGVGDGWIARVHGRIPRLRDRGRASEAGGRPHSNDVRLRRGARATASRTRPARRLTGDAGGGRVRRGGRGGTQAVATGVLRGVGDTRTPMVMNVIGHWVFGLPVGWALCFWYRWGVSGLWVGLSIGLIFVAVVLTIAWHSKSRHLVLPVAVAPV